MISFFNKHKKVIFVATTTIFLGGIFVGLGSYLIGDVNTRTAVARVGKVNISYDKFRDNVYRYLDMMQRQSEEEVTDETKETVKKQALQEMVITEVFVQSAADYGMMVTDFELAETIKSVPFFKRGDKFDEEIYRRMLWQTFKIKPAEFEAEERSRMLSERFKNLLVSACKITPNEILQAFLMQGKNFKDFAKERKEVENRLKQLKFLILANYHMALFAKEKGLQDFLAIREQGQ